MSDPNHYGTYSQQPQQYPSISPAEERSWPATSLSTRPRSCSTHRASSPNRPSPFGGQAPDSLASSTPATSSKVTPVFDST